MKFKPLIPDLRGRTSKHAVYSALLREAGRFLKFIAEKEPGLCPKCSYRMVEHVAKVRQRKQDPLHFWRCSACARRYKSHGDGPFMTPSHDEWSEHVKKKFPREPVSVIGST